MSAWWPLPRTFTHCWSADGGQLPGLHRVQALTGQAGCLDRRPNLLLHEGFLGDCQVVLLSRSGGGCAIHVASLRLNPLPLQTYKARRIISIVAFFSLHTYAPQLECIQMRKLCIIRIAIMLSLAKGVSHSVGSGFLESRL